MTMADVRCPMCSTINPADATACSVCGARLKPMIAGAAGGLAGPPEAGPGEGPDWLARIRERQKTELEAAAEEAPPPSADDDWLGRLRREEFLPTEPEAPQGEEPEREAPPLGPRPPSRPLPPISPPPSGRVPP